MGSIREIEAAARQPNDEAQLNEILASGLEVRTRFERACVRAGVRTLRVCACAHTLLCASKNRGALPTPLPGLRASGRMPCLLTSASSASQSLWATLLVVLERFEDALTAYSRWRKTMAATICNVPAAVDISRSSAKVCRSSDVTAHAHLRRALPL